ncbi:DUF4279 domain-containing protein [Sorangium sp. So ce321]|uniref:DUF4279 domain-containing protein n=1 Tax=Sorangium sp. So ce321 TaxID=3133300 RepID=UPI003F62151E
MKDDEASRHEERADIAHVELGLSGDRVVPAEVTAVIGLLPSRAWSKGDSYESKAGGVRKRPFGIWVITAEGSDVEQCALGLLAVAEPRAAAIRQAAEAAGATVSVGVWWEPEGGQGGFTVASDVLRRISELCDRVDVYFPG